MTPALAASLKQAAQWRAQGQTQQALALCSALLDTQPELAEAWFEQGLLLDKLRQTEAAMASYDRVIALRPDFIPAYLNRGNALNTLRRPEQALATYLHALRLKANALPLLVNIGATLQKLGRYQEALHAYQHVLQLRPDHADALSNRGNIEFMLQRYSQALDSYAQAQAYHPMHVGANFNESLCQLLLGNFGPGWQKYEWRWHTRQLAHGKRHIQAPLWLGYGDLRGKTILLHAEQGFGDTIQFCRYVSWVASLGAQVLLEVQAPLRSLMAQLPGVRAIYVRGEALPKVDCHCPLMSLPLAHRTRLATIPPLPAGLRPTPQQLADWTQRLGAKSLPRIGLVCSGSTGHVDDRNRSIPLVQMAQALAGPVQLFCVQKELRQDDAARIAAGDIGFFGPQLGDFSDTAALLLHMDLVITVDTAVAHLAATLGKPVWILLPFVPDWRWLLQRSDSPWYPSVRLFRQSAPGDWLGPLREVAVEFHKSWQADAAAAPPVAD
ncbi:tetratricopeptide repeat protein [Duganella sp. FT135W]|uniref:Tetratricopeptide repeat protein n=1 Tax=Duganella flavida TaxID=2692175 RepID=A0A6L8K7J3_9BURK|nr:tetratricopeptide repeat protein [Duganella flavida]MYM22985.1 tetratricopeptide repeat protein [Duganella flavida]